MIKRFSLLYIGVTLLAFFNLRTNAQTVTSYSILSTAYDRANAAFRPLGAVDADWFLIRIQDLTVPLNPATIINYPNNPTFVVPNSGNNNFPGIIANHSINFNSSTTSPGLKLVTYRTYFTLPNLNATTDRFSLHFKMCADDAVDNVELNGTQRAKYLSPTFNNLPAFPKPYMLDIPLCDTDFVSGQNYIDVTVADAGGSIGYYAEIELFKTTNATGPGITVNSATICPQQTVTLTASGAGSYTWSTGQTTNSIVVSPAVTTIYTVNTMPGLCVSGATTTVSVMPSPSISVTGNTGICSGQSTTLTANGAITYTWSTGATTASINVIPAGTITYSVSGSILSCSNTAAVTVTVNALPVISQLTVKNADCGLSNGSATLAVLPATCTYSLNNNSTSNPINNLSGGNYSVTVSNNGCVTQTVATVTQQAAPVISQVILFPATCGLANGSATITATTSNNVYNWNPATASATNTAYGLTGGNYTVSVVNGNCYADTVIVILGSTAIQINSVNIIPSDCDINNGEIHLDSISVGASPYTVYFNNTLTTSTSFNALGANTYTIAIKDFAGCEKDFLFNVPSNHDFTLYVPNCFTPNKDKVNDVWYALGACIEEYQCDIFNRWGQKIIQLNNIADGWDGKYKGAEVPDGVYVYVMEVKIQGETIRKAGHITLFR